MELSGDGDVRTVYADAAGSCSLFKLELMIFELVRETGVMAPRSAVAEYARS